MRLVDRIAIIRSPEYRARVIEDRMLTSTTGCNVVAVGSYPEFKQTPQDTYPSVRAHSYKQSCTFEKQDLRRLFQVVSMKAAKSRDVRTYM